MSEKTKSTNKDSTTTEEIWKNNAMLKAIPVLLTEIINENKTQKIEKLGNYSSFKFR